MTEVSNAKKMCTPLIQKHCSLNPIEYKCSFAISRYVCLPGNSKSYSERQREAEERDPGNEVAGIPIPEDAHVFARGGVDNRSRKREKKKKNRTVLDRWLEIYRLDFLQHF